MTEQVVIQEEVAEPIQIVEEADDGSVVVEQIEAEVLEVEIAIEGPRGYPGPSAYEVALANGFVGTEEEWLESLSVAGPPGPAGGDLSYRHVQNNPAEQWGSEEEPINHNLGKYPNHGIITSAGDYKQVGIVHLDINNCYLTLSGPDSGKAYFN